MAIPTKLATGEHWLLSDPVTRWEIQPSDTNPPSVVMTASISSPNPPIFPPPAGTTSVALQMDAQVAIGLYENLGDLIRFMRWEEVHMAVARSKQGNTFAQFPLQVV